MNWSIFSSLILSFLSACIIIIYTELWFLKKYLILTTLYSSVGISLFKALCTSESESDTLNNQTGCSYVSWALFAVSRYKISCCHRFIVKKENSWSLSLTFPFSWHEFNIALILWMAWQAQKIPKVMQLCAAIRKYGFLPCGNLCLDSFPSWVSDKGQCWAWQCWVNCWSQWSFPA